MLRNVKDLRGFALLATDGVIGKVDDLYFDDEDYRYVPEQFVRVITRSDGHEVPICGSPRYERAAYERAATKQASKKEIRDARRLLEREPLCAESW